MALNFGNSVFPERSADVSDEGALNTSYNGPAVVWKVVGTSGNTEVYNVVTYTVPAHHRFCILGAVIQTANYLTYPASCNVTVSLSGTVVRLMNVLDDPLQIQNMVMAAGDTIGYDYHSNDSSGNLSIAVYGYEYNG